MQALATRFYRNTARADDYCTITKHELIHQCKQHDSGSGLIDSDLFFNLFSKSEIQTRTADSFKTPATKTQCNQ